VNGRHIVLVH